MLSIRSVSVLVTLLILLVTNIDSCAASASTTTTRRRDFVVDLIAGANVGLQSALTHKRQQQRPSFLSSSTTTTVSSPASVLESTSLVDSSSPSSSSSSSSPSPTTPTTPTTPSSPLACYPVLRNVKRQGFRRNNNKNNKVSVEDQHFVDQGLLEPLEVSSSTTTTTSLSQVQDVKATKTKKAAATATTTTKTATKIQMPRSLTFYESMIAGAISRSVAQTIMHPANTMKTILQTASGASELSVVELMRPKYFMMLTRGAGANFLLSVPHGAINFAVIEGVRKELDHLTRHYSDRKREQIGPALDFLSSAISTICCSVVSTPQMMITDNIMAGNYPNLPRAISGMYQQGFVNGFYSGWWPGLVGKIPSYGMTWAFFQQLKVMRLKLTNGREATNIENSIMGCISSGTTVTIMIPLDTIKTRLVTQNALIRAGKLDVAYKGILDCAIRVTKEEGFGAFYKGLPPRLVSVVPMIGIQFGVYEFMKRFMVKRQLKNPAAVRDDSIVMNKQKQRSNKKNTNEDYDALEEAAMEVAADAENPYPAPHFHLKKLLSPKSVQNRAVKI